MDKIHGTELASMNYSNTPTRPQCNLLPMPPHLCLLQLYSKMGAVSGCDHLIPHLVNALTKDLLIQACLWHGHFQKPLPLYVLPITLMKQLHCTERNFL